MRFLITGAKGQLARAFIGTFQDTHHTAIAPDEEGLDICHLNSVLDAISEHEPDVVLNCAAYNWVDKAEEDFDVALLTNAKGVENLALACKKHRALLVHFGTDYVFDGTKEDFYTEEDEPNPINNYGKSKLLGEKFLVEGTDDFLLFRVSWVYGEGRQNFLYKLSQWAEKNKVLRVVCDQTSVPTFAEDIAKFTRLAVENGVRGIYHFTNGGYASRFEVARYFIERLGLDRLILPVTSDYFPAPAKRPRFSAMSNAKISRALDLDIPDWKSGIDRFIENILGRIG
jgi:dTDP-4-dehydrorhamnose reductase